MKSFTKLTKLKNNTYTYFFSSFTLYPAYSRVGRENLVLRHFVIYFPRNFRGIACEWGIQREEKRNNNKFLQVCNELTNIESKYIELQPSRYTRTPAPLRHNGLISILIVNGKNNLKICKENVNIQNIIL